MNKFVFTAIQWTWGLPQNLAGAVTCLAHRGCSHFKYKGSRVTMWDRDDGLSLGRFIFVPKKNAESLLAHEYGHTVQSLMMGPAYLPVVGLSSIVWNRLPYFRRIRREKGISYYSAWFEKTATLLGERHADRYVKKTGLKGRKKV